MGWFDSLFGSDDAETGGADEGRGAGSESHDPFGRIVAEPVFDAFRDAWKAGAGLFDLFGSERQDQGLARRELSPCGRPAGSNVAS